MNKQDEVVFKIELSKREAHHTIFFENAFAKQYVLSKYQPKRDAINQLGEERGNKQTIWVILGFALGYMVKELLEDVAQELEIIVIEPNEKLLEAQMNYEENEKLRNKDNVHFICGENFGDLREKIKQCIPNAELSNIKIVPVKKYLEYYCDYYNNIKSILEEVIMYKVVDRNTTLKYANLFTKNVIQNRYDICEGYDLSIVKGQLKDVPALVVSGGPSLNKNIEFIKKFKGIIFVGNRTLSPVIAEGIEPDFIVALDPENIAHSTLGDNADNHIDMIVTDQCNHKVIEAHKGKKYFVNTHSGAEDLLGVNVNGGIAMGGSVATLCTSVAQYMGCNPIVFIGQDCAYTDMKVHAEVCSNQKMDKNTSNDIQSQNRELIQIEGYYGDKVWSSYDLISFLRWFENFIKKDENTTYINATEGGAKIEGAYNEPFSDVVERYKDIIKPDLKQYNSKLNHDINVDSNLAQVNELLKGVKKEVVKAKKASEELEKEYKVYYGKRIKQINALVCIMDEVDEYLKKDRQLINFTKNIFTRYEILRSSIIEQKEGIHESEYDKGLRIARHCYAVYSNIADTCEEITTLIEEYGKQGMK